MPTEIKCPNCAHVFPMEEAMAEDYKKELREKAAAYARQKDEEYQRKLQIFESEKQQQLKAFDAKLAEEKTKLKDSLEENLRKSISADFETKLQMLEGNAKDNAEKLKLAREKELEFLRREESLKVKEEEMELAFQRKMQEQRNELVEQIRKQEAEKNSIKDTEHQLRLKELEKQLDDQKKLAEEMKRKAEQGSMQLQGEVQELILEELLRTNYPFDLIEEVGKGVRGADCVQVVRNQFGQECGKIIYESKRTKDFGGDWIEKLKKDMRSMGIDVAVIVSQCYPKGMDCFGQRDGVWICSFEEVNAVAYVLREGILRLAGAVKSQENRGEKMHMLYDYLMGAEFSEQWKAIREGFMSMKLSIQRERDAMERLWKAREKQLEKVLLNATHIRGSIEGIAGSDSVQLSLTDEDDDTLLLE
ncbi:hypothetical protein SRABI27_02752 [Pedobacter sp. Bi27]|jgi:hypothetical protein|uniref:DUF2130 domain-containing protein n=1 Tax=unclassified Pedobacter TaxID=2628915 RepID=UPI001D8830DE|nr:MULTISPECIES: DUF2130 domain-containing protein [unclassified Pedobacter]CAH0242318.1 hypothetical protein SRABI27_02752 [Pedobacter sp. Bi27]CAH0255343.1 hypothetical protein SRABI36_03327 [Pedobacter sp. Bi36]CAH0279723.1 hypothetical protein SRABI126_03730 [Pedobacter sp. Bi126]